MLSYYVIYCEKFRKVLQLTEKVVLSYLTQTQYFSCRLDKLEDIFDALVLDHEMPCIIYTQGVYKIMLAMSTSVNILIFRIVCFIFYHVQSLISQVETFIDLSDLLL